ncbi:MAG: AraC family transcriptional regulator [Chryseolinea sp.]
MKRYYQYQPIVIEDFEAATWRHPVHRHNHYELIYINKGTGFHVINGTADSYKSGDIFLLGPDDDHYFDIREQTRFIYVKFVDLHIYKGSIVTYPGLQKLEYLAKSGHVHFSEFKLTSEDLNTIDQLFNVMSSLKSRNTQNEEIIWLQVLSIAAILQRNMPELRVTKAGKRNKEMQAIFSYLHQHIYGPEKLRAKVIAAEFNTTADYIGPYFKRNTGFTLRNYIRNYRKSLINQRISSGRYSLKEIAAEFGLTDASHASKGD